MRPAAEGDTLCSETAGGEAAVVAFGEYTGLEKLNAFSVSPGK